MYRPRTGSLALKPSHFLVRSSQFHPILMQARFSHNMAKEPGETSTSHAERTAAQPRDSALNSVTLIQVNAVNENIRLFRLGVKEGSRIEFLPGQWLDTYVPGVPKAGGFTLTSSPSKAILPSSAYLELAVQKSPMNPAAAWLWDQPVDEVEDEGKDDGAVTQREKKPEIQVRVGGSFVWPPPGGEVDLGSLRRIVFIAGGVGVNPLMSIVSHLAEGGSCPYDVQFMYSTKVPSEGLDSEKILFMERLASIFGRERVRGQLRLFLTGLGPLSSESDGSVLLCNEIDVPFKRRRMELEDVAEALGPEVERGHALVYVCGIPSMTDELVESLTSKSGLGLRPERVLCERWW
ncbi:NADH-cytochrome b-5 reductase [Colletotrichum godetiae]|uniref:NADH-cytochrome b-5 reductase n=1 Tax=Colletotrichum godetiae TaxID=1209918 RepID=A0AAJ0ACS6_9PEZI|nr:NADH-cytochrome b-5 reductase [Colletotrichum godetiae]KAK1659246.1 NADH-cytochrome b-5 reductase [Colletotrichum godetiae]